MEKKFISRKLMELRENVGLTRVQLAKITGLSLRAIESYEQGARVPRDEVKIILAKTLGTTVQAIFFEE